MSYQTEIHITFDESFTARKIFVARFIAFVKSTNIFYYILICLKYIFKQNLIT